MPSNAVNLEIKAALEDFRFNEAGFLELMRGPVSRDLVRRAILVEGAAKTNATGRPGPNVVTGRLRGSITWRLGADPISPYVDIGSAVFYAPFLEFGTSKMPPYPFLRPALEAARADF